jgi:hypothetical protein
VQNHPHGLAGCPHEQSGTRLSYRMEALAWALLQHVITYFLWIIPMGLLLATLIGDVPCTGGVAGSSWSGTEMG